MDPDVDLLGWYYTRGEKRYGPFSREHIASLLSAGVLEPTEKLIEIAETATDTGIIARYSYVDAQAAVAGSERSP